ncbi:uncharacterized protein LOC131681083 [Topomyia yanbarensis]|uniref:uncharacterized protein LOC131681083 n=1 Tax=Topomyia yanbarensis TaxID=2498891 RepID=UPI00273C5776|nr:uncharacterized protein LOC131681083 [Topomyia yanbarensis]
MKYFLYITLISILLGKHYGLTHVIRKRQLFREQVLPHAGGKIPDSAFHTDRLALNQLQKEGFAVPDGVLLEQRRYQVYHHPYRTVRPTFMVAQTTDGRYTSHGGQNEIGAVDSTYSIPMPWEKDPYQKHTAKYYHRLPLAVPVFKELRIPQHSVFNFDYSHLKSKLQPVLTKRPITVHPAAPVVTGYTPPVSLFHNNHSPMPSLSSPQSFVSYHAALGNLLSYQPAFAYSNGWSPPSVFHPDPDFLSHPLSSFEDFYGDPSGKQRYYRNVNHHHHEQQQSGSTGTTRGEIRQSRASSTGSFEQQQQTVPKGRKSSPLLSAVRGVGATSSLVSSTRQRKKRYSMAVKAITDEAHFQTELAAAGGKLVVVDFTAAWCGPCRNISHLFDQLPAKYPKAVFLKADVDRSCMNLEKITVMNVALKHLHPEEPVRMFERIERTPDGECAQFQRSVPSDCDDQLIISITFNQPVKISAIKFKAPPSHGPKKVSVQDLVLGQKDLVPGSPIPLHFVKFQNVQNMQLFVKDNHSGDETTIIDHLAFIGSPIATTKMDDFQRVAGKKGAMLKLAFLAAAGLLCAVQCIKVDYYGSLYHQDELHAPYKSAKEPKQDFNKIPGVPGVDYPIYHEVPHTSFSCDHVPAVPGMYANVETGCQAYHTCHDGREGPQGASFLCTNGTVFNQKEFACDWWYNVKCEEAPSLYALNTDPEHNPFVPKRKPEDELQHHKFLINV